MRIDRDRRRVLVIAYYFPPMGLSGVQRIARFVKYLPDFGWEPTVLTIRPGGYFAFDTSLSDELAQRRIDVSRTRSIDPTRLFGRRATVSMPKETRRKAISELSQWFMLPDNKIGWLPFALREGNRLMTEQHFDAVLSTAPPYTAHLIGAALSRRHRVPLLLDYRDDWLDNPRHVYPTSLHKRIHRSMEQHAAANASAVVSINSVIASAITSRVGKEVGVIEQGFDPQDFSESIAPDPDVFRLTYTGVFYDAQRPDTFLSGCARFLERRPEARQHLKLDFAGTLSENAIDLARSLGLADLLTFHGYLPHPEVVRLQQRSNVLWMVIGRRPGAESISTGKLFEYIGANKPILALVPDGAARDLLGDYNMAVRVDPDAPEDIAEALDRLYDDWTRGTSPKPDADFISRFDRRLLTGRLASMLDAITIHREPR